ncbi:MAG TPA: TraR/DksA C4-type zinc finger protein [Micromonosporaceae bacterium]|jgi:DnaK suppressor protein
MTQTLAAPTGRQPAQELFDMLTRRRDEAADAWTRQDMLVQASRAAIDLGPGDEADRATTYAQLHEQTALADTLRMHLDELESAIRRAEAGSYGFCDGCGDTIAAGRLELFPAATHCVTCKQRRSPR